jgi:hypothetical protein
MANPVVRWMHQDLIGHALKVDMQKTRIKVTDKLAPTALVLSTVWPLAQNGSLKAFSIGFNPLKWEDQGEVRTWTEWALLEHSLVDVPANPKAQADAVKQMARVKGYDCGPVLTKGPTAVKHPAAEDTELPWSAAQAEKRVRAWAGAEEAPNAQYASCFLWHYSEAAEDFGAYKLLVCDIIGGEPQVLWRAVAACMAALRGGRGGVDLPAGDQAAVLGYVEDLYSKFGKEPPEKLAEAQDWKDGLRAGEQQVVEIVQFTERVARLCGAAQGAQDILKHWQRAGLDPQALRALDSEGIERLRESGAHLKTLLAGFGGDSESPGLPGEAIKAALRELDPYAKLAVALSA